MRRKTGSVAILQEERSGLIKLEVFRCAMVAFSKLALVAAAPAAGNQLFAAPAPRVAAPQARREETRFSGGNV